MWNSGINFAVKANIVDPIYYIWSKVNLAMVITIEHREYMQKEMKLTHTTHKKQEAHVLNNALRRKFLKLDKFV